MPTRRGVFLGRWTSTPNELLRTGAQRSTLFLGPTKNSGIKIPHHLTSQDLSVMLREAVTPEVMHSGWWKGRCLMIFKKEQVMTEISLAGGRWHSVRLAFVRFVKGLHQQTCKALSNGLIFTEITLYCTYYGQKWGIGSLTSALLWIRSYVNKRACSYFLLGQKTFSKGQHVDCLSSQWSGAPEL